VVKEKMNRLNFVEVTENEVFGFISRLRTW